MSFAQQKHFPSAPSTRNATTSDLELLAASSEASSLLPKRSQSTSTIGRLPYHYDAEKSESRDELASRYRYYSRLDPRSNCQLRMPSHVAPANFFSVLPFGDGSSKQGSLVTIFSIWNAMVGSALLTMPWALHQAGFFLGLGLFCVMPIIAFYTAYLIIKIPQGMNFDANADFPEIIGYFWGRRMERFAASFSVVVLFGGVIVYWILMSNFLFGTGTVIHDSISPMFGDKMDYPLNISICGVVCADDIDNVEQSTSKDAYFHKWWHLKSVPLYLAIIVLPLLMFKDAMFFQKFNGAGTISVIYIVIYVLVKTFNCGIHLDLVNDKAISYVKPVDNHFWSLTGTLSLSLFLHNSIINIMRHQRNPENNVRDLSWAFALSSLTYFIVGVAFYAMFPLAKSCISDNLLNNYLPNDMLSSVARLFLLFQILTVFSLFSFLIRTQVLTALLGIENPKKRWVLVLNIGILVICTMFAILMPSVGNIIRFVGSFIGLVYMFILPCGTYLKKLQLQGSITKKDIALHSSIVLLGIVNCIGQFLIF